MTRWPAIKSEEELARNGWGELAQAGKNSEG